MTQSPVYLSYDRFPAPKGAAVHIDAFTGAIADAFGPIDLVTLFADTPESQKEKTQITPGKTPEFVLPEANQYRKNISHYAISAEGENFISRVLNFRDQLGFWWGDRKVPFTHFRSIYEGYPLAIRKNDVCEKIIYEVNAVPSIELKYHYPNVADDRELLQKLKTQEDICLEAADLVVTPSQVTAEYLQSRSVDQEKIRVIPNGVDLKVFSYQDPLLWPKSDEPVKVLYSGTVSAWQGVQIALEAVALYCRDFPAELTIIGHSNITRQRDIMQTAQKLKITDKVKFLDPVPQAELAKLYHSHHVAVAPLIPNDRNLVQGCCPLKILEAAATGIPLIASDMPVVTDLVEAEKHAILVKPGSAKSVKDGMLRLKNESGFGSALSKNARKHIEENFDWEKSKEDLINAYREKVA